MPAAFGKKGTHHNGFSPSSSSISCIPSSTVWDHCVPLLTQYEKYHKSFAGCEHSLLPLLVFVSLIYLIYTIFSNVYCQMETEPFGKTILFVFFLHENGCFSDGTLSAERKRSILTVGN